MAYYLHKLEAKTILDCLFLSHRYNLFERLFPKFRLDSHVHKSVVLLNLHMDIIFMENLTKMKTHCIAFWYYFQLFLKYLFSLKYQSQFCSTEWIWYLPSRCRSKTLVWPKRQRFKRNKKFSLYWQESFNNISPRESVLSLQ